MSITRTKEEKKKKKEGEKKKKREILEGASVLGVTSEVRNTNIVVSKIVHGDESGIPFIHS